MLKGKEKGIAGKIGAGVVQVLGGCFYLLTACCVLGGEGRPVRTDGRRVSEQAKGVRIKKVESRGSEKTTRIKKVESRASEKTARSDRAHR